MKVAIVLACVLAAVSAGLVAPATTLVRTPSLDSAVIQSDRLGGNFAYSSVEGHAYAAVSPVVQNVVRPVAVSYAAHQVPLGYAVSAPAVHYAAPALHYAAPAVHYAYAPNVIPGVPAASLIPGSGLLVASSGSAPAQPAADAPAAPAAPASDAAASSDDTVSVEAN